MGHGIRPIEFGNIADLLCSHTYTYAWESFWHIARARTAMAAHGLDKEVWLNESGVPAWDDYPGPTWDPDSPFRSTMQEGAAYVVQSALYARYAGASVVYHFMLYDDCGNYPPGTDFPPADPPWSSSPRRPSARPASVARPSSWSNRSHASTRTPSNS